MIIVTTKDQETDRVWGKRQGAKDYLTKPIGEATLIETINAVLIGWMLLCCIELIDQSK